MTEPTEPDFDGCRRACRLAGAHTLVSGECEHAPAPEPTVSLSHVYTDTDGRKSIGFDTYTVDQLAELLDPVLGGEAMRARKGSVDLAHLAAHAIVHRNDERAAAPAGPSPATDRQAAYDAVFAYIRQRPVDFLPATVVDRNAMIWRAVHAALDAVLPAPTDRAAVLREEAARIRDHCPDHLDSDSAPGSWMACHCDVADDMLRRLAEAQQDRECTNCGGSGLDPRYNGEFGCPDCQPARVARQDPTQDGTEARAPFIPPAHYRGRDGTVYCVHATPVGPDSCSECRDLADEGQPAAPARSGQPDTDEDDELVHVGWWCWRGDNHGHLATMPCRSDNVPIHVPAEWADDMRAVLQRIEDGDEPDTDPETDPS